MVIARERVAGPVGWGLRSVYRVAWTLLEDAEEGMP